MLKTTGQSAKKDVRHHLAVDAPTPSRKRGGVNHIGDSGAEDVQAYVPALIYSYPYGEDEDVRLTVRAAIVFVCLLVVLTITCGALAVRMWGWL